MKYCDLTLPTPEENLALDEVLLDFCEAGAGRELLRVWEPTQYFVVVGYANRVATEVNLDFCRKQGIAVRRRCTGGGTVLQGPGCLNYSLVLRLDGTERLQSISGTNDFIMERHRLALSSVIGDRVEKQGHTDLALGGLKFSGNAQRRRQHCLLFHGTFLLDLDLELVERALPLPSKQPAYRANRAHRDFLMNLRVPAPELKAALAAAWGARQELADIPLKETRRLAGEKYASEEWNWKF